MSTAEGLALAQAPTAFAAGEPKRDIQQGYYRTLVTGQRRGVLSALARAGLAAAERPYSTGVAVRNWLYDHNWRSRHTAPVPVISIGNLTLGGTGKTPAVECVARTLVELGNRPAILSRGYGATAGRRNDEALVLDTNLPGIPHLQGVDRVALAFAVTDLYDVDVLILDDGFQHRRLHRNLDMVLIDATDPWGGGRLFPRRLLREPVVGLARADLVVLTRCDQVDAQTIRLLHRRLATLTAAPVIECVHAPVRLVNSYGEEAALETLRERVVVGFCGLGNPAAFRATLAGLGCMAAQFELFPDHHGYAAADFERLSRCAEMLPADGVVLTTQKDLVKLSATELGGRPLWAVQIALSITQGRDIFDNLLKGVLP